MNLLMNFCWRCRCCVSSVPPPLQKRVFTDKLQVVVRGGRGGNGCSSFKYWGDGKRAPDGAAGGPGGAVYLEVSDDMQNLDHIPGSIRGESLISMGGRVNDWL